MKLMFPVKFAKFLRTTVFTELLRWLFLKIKEGLREVPFLLHKLRIARFTK